MIYMIEYTDALGIEQIQPYEFGSPVSSTTELDHDEICYLPGIFLLSEFI